jgi:arylsulfatase
MLRRRDLLLASAPALLRAATRRPNILWLMTDEQRPDSLGCYRSPWAHSPVIDSLAAEGALFESAYVPSPVCVPCRSALLTGQAASVTGVLHNRQRLRPDAVFLTWRFEEAGYQTATFGKKHYFGGSGRPAFQVEQGSATEDVVHPEYFHAPYEEAGHDVVKYPKRTDTKEVRNWILAGRFPAAEDQSAEVRNLKLAQTWLDGRDKDKPFLLRLSLNAPHTPVVVPSSYLPLIDPGRIRIPEPTAAQLAGQPHRDRIVMRGFQGSHVLTPAQLNKARHYYYARCAFADAVFGRLLDYMRARGLLDNTVIVMTSDHGAHLGDQGMVQKQTFYEQVATVPYLFWSKEHVRPGSRFRVPVNINSLLPTVLDLAGLPAGGGQERSLAPSLRRGAEPPRAPVISEIAFGYQGWRDQERQAMIRDGDYKMTLFPDAADPDGALYDLRRDPGETTNLFNNAGQQRTVRRLRERLVAALRRRGESAPAGAAGGTLGK